MGFIKHFVKKYAALMPPMGLLILAIVLFVPTLWFRGQVKAQMDGSIRQSQTIRGMMNSVPSRDKPDQIRAYMDRLEAEVQQIDDLIRQSSQRELVAWNIFPEPRDTSAQVYVEFGRNYQKAIERMLQEMNALDAPSENEIRQRTGTARTPGAAVFGVPGTTRRAPAQDPMVDALCIARAESISVYAGPSAFAWYDFWQNFQFAGKDTALQDCWNSQIALWIYDDVVKSIQAMNVGSGRVSTSPVKRLLGVRFSGPVQVSSSRAGEMYGMMPGAGTGRGVTAGRDNLSYVTDARPSVFMQQTVFPWTGRAGGAEYDVVHFAVSVIIDNRHILGFMRELCSEKEHTFREGFKEDGRIGESRHNQITILQSTVHAIDKDGPVHELYRYGNGAAMRLDLVCEYLLNREGYDMIKPDPVKKVLGQLEGQPDTPGMPGGGFPGGL